jgi:hypothetical protein
MFGGFPGEGGRPHRPYGVYAYEYLSLAPGKWCNHAERHSRSRRGCT